MQIGNFSIAPGAALAPMAGFTDAACRRMAARHGAVYTISEMVSAKALTFGDKKSARLLRRGEDTPGPYGVQLFGAEPETMGQAAALIADKDFDFYDINMGCPAPKITSSGAGSKLMLDPALAGQIVAAVVQNGAGRPVTVKIRAGWDAQHVTAVEVAKACEAAGAAVIAVHARTREQMYQPGIDLDIIRQVKQGAAVTTPSQSSFTCLKSSFDDMPRRTSIVRGWENSAYSSPVTAVTHLYPRCFKGKYTRSKSIPSMKVRDCDVAYAFPEVSNQLLSKGL